MRNLQQLIDEGHNSTGFDWIYRKNDNIGTIGYRISFTDEETGKVWFGQDDKFPASDFYIHPYSPDKEIKRVEIFADIPGAKKGKVFDAFTSKTNGRRFVQISNILAISYSMETILFYPQFFKPLYE